MYLFAWKFSEIEGVGEDTLCGIRDSIDGIDGGRMLEDIEGRNIGSSAGMELVRARLDGGIAGVDKFGLL